MTFEEILDQAIAMLQRRGRLTYGTLKRQFQLDDAVLEDLKDALIYGQRVAADEDGRVLVWTGGTGMAPATAPRAPQPATQEASRSQVEAAPTIPPPPRLRTREAPLPQAEEPPPTPRLPTPNVASLPCCSVTWWIPRCWPASS